MISEFRVSLVKILVIYDDPQITKARSEYFKPGIKEFTGLCMFSLLRSSTLHRCNKLKCSNCNKQLIFTRSLITNNKNNSELAGTYIEAVGSASQKEKSLNKLNPWFVTGFTDAEGCFLINIRPNSKMKIGYSVELVFKIGLHIKDKALVINFRNFFGVGTVTTRGSDCIQYWVGSLKDLQVIVNHFDNYPLISQKFADFLLFRQVIDLMKRKEHLNLEGLNKIVSKKSSLNKGLSDDLMIAFPGVLSAIRPQVMSPKIMDPNWVSGFVNGDGSFFLVTKKSLKGGSVGFRLLVTQHIRDADLLKSLIDYLGCGKYYPRLRTPMYGDYLVTSLDDFKNKIIPFFDKYPLQGVKSYDFNDLKKVFWLREYNNGKITPEILENIEQIKHGMNTGRVEEEDLPPGKKKVSVSYPLQGSRKVTTSQTSKRYYSTSRTIDNYLKKSGSIFNPRPSPAGPGWKGVIFKNKEVQICLLFCYFNLNIYYNMLVGISEAMLVFMFFKPRNNNKFNSFVKILRLKIINKQFKYLHSNLYKLSPLFIKLRMNKGRKVKSYVFEVRSTLGDIRYYSLTRTAYCDAVNKASAPFGGLEKGKGSSKVQAVTISRGASVREGNYTSVVCDKFKEWLAGFIDGRGQFFKYKKGTSGLKIVTNKKDKSLLYLIQHKYGGSVKEISGSKALKYKLVNPIGLGNLIQEMNGLIRNPIKMLQLNRLYEKKGIELKEPQPLSYYNGWFSGFLDSDGSIYIDEESWQLIISVTQKNRFLLEPLQILYGGKIITTPDAFKLSIYRKEGVLKLVDDYLNRYPLKSHKALNVGMIKKFYQLGSHSNLWNKGAYGFEEWIKFKSAWDRIVY